MKGNKNKSKKDTFKKIAQNKGVYIALFAVVMMVGFYVYARQMKEATEADVVSFDENAWQEAIAESDIEVIDIDSTVKTTTEKEEKLQQPKADEKKTTNTSDKQEEPAVETSASAPRPFAMTIPCEGKIAAECSVDELVYCSAMDDWRTHNGVDIAAAVGDPVKAAEDGVVSKVYEDEFLGIVVEVDHQNGITSLYGNLQNIDFISTGVKVKQGDIIGGVGTPGALEADLDPHLHFEVMCNGQLKDPSEYIAFE